ncbi:MAG: hypothetical protein JRF08_07845 [Deltaproteobacteria bacterium]|nr:hypothetical protein [Deltaproteobacteria bacterium]MBW2333323.1 hypothetical protein [Deltaproteobacteria bacterium]MCD6265049.1 hypothetical protein [Deltaproteobacteria bacterium]RLB22502.1 MAG: hypothetical protein DRG73_06790 [Deltaproteobacteria bacterium]
MKIEEILQSIDKSEEFIQRIVEVEYVNRLQCPMKTLYQKQEHKVTELPGTFKGNLSPKNSRKRLS